VQITPSEAGAATVFRDGDRFSVPLDDLNDNLRELGRLGDRLPPFNFNFDFDLHGGFSGRRLGVSVDELTDQLATYFGAKQGLLVTSVTDGSAASQAGLKAGDVITSINGRTVRSRDDLVQELRDSTSDEITIGIVRDKKESSVTAKVDAAPRRNLRGARPA
jgi:S1-C subfamily serine protease